MTTAKKRRVAPQRYTAAKVRRELITHKRRLKRSIVESARRGWLDPKQAQFLINALGLRHE